MVLYMAWTVQRFRLLVLVVEILIGTLVGKSHCFRKYRSTRQVQICVALSRNVEASEVFCARQMVFANLRMNGAQLV